METANNKNNTLPTSYDEISTRLVSARSSGDALSDFPGELPQTLADAYSIQRASIERWPDSVGGWKIGMLPEADQLRYSAKRLVGPIFKSSIQYVETDSLGVATIFDGGFAAVEAEFVLQIACDISPSNGLYSDQQLADMVSAMYVGAEIASSPMADINKIGPTCVVSDFGNNAGLLLGEKVDDWSCRALHSLTSQVYVDGKLVGDASAAAIPGGPLQALRFLIELFGRRGIVLEEGALISTGASTGIHEVSLRSSARVEFGEFGGFDLRFEPVS